MKIKLLDSYVFNRIAAGEVVERPASVIKETVENSIDAGATFVSVSVLGGGIREINIIDNGCGIEEEDIELAFLPHATSKISTVDDLDNILTYGFRGEALASISAVSKIKIKTKTETMSKGVSCDVECGKITEKQYVSANVGTELTISNLFYNTPARAKYLKKEKQEETAITQTMIRLMIANPNVAFDYYADGKQIYSVSGRGFEDCVKTIFGASVFEQMIFFSSERKGVKISGYISEPTFFKNNRNYQITVLNNRVIVNQTITTAIYRGYGTALMKGAHPLFFIHINADGEKMDINVTPNKSDVRFVDNDWIFSAAYHFIVDALEQKRITDAEKLKNELRGEQIVYGQPQDKSDKKAELDRYFKEFKFDDPNDVVIKSDLGEKLNAPQTKLNINLSNKQQEVNAEKTETKLIDQSVAPWLNIGNFTNSVLPNVEEKPVEQPKKVEPEIVESVKADTFLSDSEQYKIIGQIFNSFVIIERGDSLYFIDEHAAVERLNYDKLMTLMREGGGEVQMLLFSEIIDLDQEEWFAFTEVKGLLENMGFEFQEFGEKCVKINGIPSVLTGLNCDAFLHSVLSNVNAEELSLEYVLHDKIAQKACKASVRAGTHLNEAEIQVLLNHLIRDNEIPLQCPHGRPTMFKMTKSEIEKKFRRL